MDYIKKADDNYKDDHIKSDIDSQIYESKKYISLLNKFEEDNILMSKSINKCINLLRESAKGENFNKSLNNLSDDNIKSLRNSLTFVDSEKDKTYGEIKKLQEKEDKKD